MSTTGSEPLTPTDEDSGQTSLLTRLGSANLLLIIIILVGLIIGFTIMEPNFIKPFNLRNLGASTSYLLVLGVGMTFVIISAGIDLSVGSVLIFSGVIAAKVMYTLGNGSAHPDIGDQNAGWGVILIGLVAGMASGLGWGLINGFLVAKAKVPPLITTLGTLGAALGASYLITGGVDVKTVPNKLNSTIGYGNLGGQLPYLVVVAIVVAVIFGLILAYTRFGRYTYAVGSNAEAARRVGINVDRQLIKVYAVMGLLSGVAGCMSLAYFGTTTIAGHTADNLSAIAAVVLGGTSLFGGVGLVAGSVIGVLIPAVLQSGFVTVRVNSFWQNVAVGIVLILAVYIDQLRRRRRERS